MHQGIPVTAPDGWGLRALVQPQKWPQVIFHSSSINPLGSPPRRVEYYDSCWEGHDHAECPG